MKLTKSQLKEIIKEEIQQLKEKGWDDLIGKDTNRVDFTISEKDKETTLQLLNKLRLKNGKQYDMRDGTRGGVISVDLDKKYESKFIRLLKKSRIRYALYQDYRLDNFNPKDVRRN